MAVYAEKEEVRARSCRLGGMGETCPECGSERGVRGRSSRWPAAICVGLALAGIVVGAVLDVRTSADVRHIGTYYEPIGSARTVAAVRLIAESNDLTPVVEQLQRMLRRSGRFTGNEISDDAALSLFHWSVWRPDQMSGFWLGHPIWLVSQTSLPVGADSSSSFDRDDQLSFWRTDWGISVSWFTSAWLDEGVSTRSLLLVLDALAFLVLLSLVAWWLAGLIWTGIAKVFGQRLGPMCRWRRFVQGAACLGVAGLALIPYRWDAVLSSGPVTPFRSSELTREDLEQRVREGTAEEAVREAILSLTESVVLDQEVAFAFMESRTLDERATSVGWPSDWVVLRETDWWREPLYEPERFPNIYGAVDPNATAYEIPGRPLRVRLFQGDLHIFLPIRDAASSSRSIHVGLMALALNVVMLLIVWWLALAVTRLARRVTERRRARRGACLRCGYDLGYPSVP